MRYMGYVIEQSDDGYYYVYRKNGRRVSSSLNTKAEAKAWVDNHVFAEENPRRRKSKKDRIPKELLLLLIGGSVAAAAAAVYIMTRPKTLLAPATPKLPPTTFPKPLPPPPPGSYNASMPLTINQLVR